MLFLGEAKLLLFEANSKVFAAIWAKCSEAVCCKKVVNVHFLNSCPMFDFRSARWCLILRTTTSAPGSSSRPSAASPADWPCRTKLSSPFSAAIRPETRKRPFRRTSRKPRSPTASTCGPATSRRTRSCSCKTLCALHYSPSKSTSTEPFSGCL